MPPVQSRWSLRRRLGLCAAGAALVIATLGGFALWSNSRVADRMGEVQAHRLKPLVQLDQVGRSLERQRAAVLATLAATDDVMQAALDEQVAKDRAELSATMESLRTTEPDARQRVLLAELATAIERSQGGGLTAVLDKLHKGQFVEADVASQTLYRPQVDLASAALDKVIRVEVELGERDYAEAVAAVGRQASLTIAATLAALLAGLGLAMSIANALQRSLGAHESDLAQGALNVSQGMLTHRIPVRGDDHASVAASLNSMSEGFSALRNVAEVSERLSCSSNDLALRTSGQAASLEETAASMEQLATAVVRNSENAKHARGLAKEASSLATQGGSAMAEAEDTMHSIFESSKRVSEIVSVMDAISFQTNILALNAAVEAARAGESGRGFAVVAQEVRALSKRSADAALEIRGLVLDSVARTQLGTKRVAEAGVTMRAIIRAVDGVTTSVEEIASASGEQSSGILQVNRAVEQLDQANQSNASLAESTSRDAGDMARQARALVASVSRFSVTEAVRETAEVIARVSSSQNSFGATPAGRNPSRSSSSNGTRQADRTIGTPPPPRIASTVPHGRSGSSRESS